jgi:hypothetical protein
MGCYYSRYWTKNRYLSGRQETKYDITCQMLALIGRVDSLTARLYLEQIQSNYYRYHM